MKNGGWGLSQMIVYTCIILGFLLVATYLVMVLYRNIDAPTANSQASEVVEDDVVEEVEDEEPTESVQNEEVYINYITAMEEATAIYIEQNVSETYEDIPLAMLVQEGYISYLYDPIDSTLCSGYSVVETAEDANIITSYIKCSNYVSEGYEVE